MAQYLRNEVSKYIYITSYRPDVAYAPFVLVEVIYVMFLTSLRNYWAIRPLTLPFGLEEVIKFNFLTSLRKLWAILDLNPVARRKNSYFVLSMVVYTYKRCISTDIWVYFRGNF